MVFITRTEPFFVAALLVMAGCIGDADVRDHDTRRADGAHVAAPDAVATRHDVDRVDRRDVTPGPPDLGGPDVDAEVADTPVSPDVSEPGGCPAPEPVHIERWHDTPWNAPVSGDAQQVIRLSTENRRHYSRAVIKFQFDTSDTIVGDWTHIGVLRNRAIPGSWQYLAWYGWLLHRHRPGNHQIEIALDGCQNGGSHVLKPNTTYDFTYDYDALASTATIEIEEVGGGSASATCPVTSSLVPIGQGLHLFVGMKTTHRDYPTVQPPAGWTFRRLVVDLTPGGPHGANAPPCP